MAERANHQRYVELLTRNQSRIFSYIYALVRNFNDAEDVFQQTCLVLWNKFDQYTEGSDFVPWACTIARYEVLNFVRKQKRRQLYFSPEFLAELAHVQSDIDADAADRTSALSTCLERLGERDRQLVELCYGDSRPFKEVAANIGRPVQQVYDALSRIRRALLECVHRKLAREEHL